MKRELSSTWGMKRTPLQRSTPLKRTPMKRKRRRYKATEKFRHRVLQRAGGRCERCGMADVFLEAHHIVPRSRGVGQPWLHDAERNGAALCAPCHSGVHAHLVHDWREWLRSEPR